AGSLRAPGTAGSLRAPGAAGAVRATGAGRFTGLGALGQTRLRVWRGVGTVFGCLAGLRCGLSPPVRLLGPARRVGAILLLTVQPGRRADAPADAVLSVAQLAPAGGHERSDRLPPRGGVGAPGERGREDRAAAQGEQHGAEAGCGPGGGER